MSHPAQPLTPQQLQAIASANQQLANVGGAPVPAQGAPPFQIQPYPGTQPPQPAQGAPAPQYPQQGQPQQINPFAAVPPTQQAPAQQQQAETPQQLMARYAAAGVTVTFEQAANMVAMPAPGGNVPQPAQQQAPQYTAEQLGQQIATLQAQQAAQQEAATQAAQEKLIAAGDYKTLFEQQQRENERIKSEAATQAANAYLATAFATAGVIDPDVARGSIDLSKVTDQTTASRAVYDLQQRASYLFRPPAQQQLPNAGAPVQLPPGSVPPAQAQPATGQQQAPQQFGQPGMHPTAAQAVGPNGPIPSAGPQAWQQTGQPLDSATNLIAQGLAEGGATPSPAPNPATPNPVFS